MKKKIDSLFALSVLVLVLGIFALACSWVPFQRQRSESNNVARADAVASVTPESFSWGVDSNSAVVHGFGNPVICATAVPSYSLYENLSGSVSITLSFTGTSAGNYVTLDVAVNLAEDSGITGVPGKFCYVVLTSSSGFDYPLSYNVQSSYSGDANNFASLNGLGIRFNKLSDYSVYTVPSETINPYDLYWSINYSGIESGTQEQWVALIDSFLRPSYDSAIYALQGALSGQVEQLETEKADLQNQLILLQTTYNTLQSDYDDLQKKYDNLFNSVSFSRVISGFPSDSFYTTKNLDPVSYNGSAVTDSGAIVTFGGKVISSSDGFVSVSYSPTQQELLVPYFKFMAFKLPFDYEYATSFVLQNVSFLYGPVYVGYADLLGSYSFDTQVSSFGMLDNVIELGQLEQGKNFYFNLPKAYSNQSVLLFYSKSDFGVSSSMVLSQVTPINEKVYDTGFLAGQDSMQGAIESARQKGFAEAQKMFDNGNTDYSFFGLISAVIDAPIKAIRGLLNFDILGVNMFSFVTSLFSLAVVLMIVKLVLGTRDVV